MVCRDLGIRRSQRRHLAGQAGLYKSSGRSGRFLMKFSRQTTLRAQATVAGVGVHSGLPVTLTLGPAPVDAGFVFVRTGLEGSDRGVQATADR